ncbi:hypothetical protein RRG08_040912 [Elysia crispata]|uniref:Uncharacterized protein n=1 Tax=Elysia crispata TaxID=231223 RepID=A0AAE0ZRM0_9GAST|nr:hypothetical protein RRG08_040912 [Elysia crispata]
MSKGKIKGSDRGGEKELSTFPKSKSTHEPLIGSTPAAHLLHSPSPSLQILEIKIFMSLPRKHDTSMKETGTEIIAKEESILVLHQAKPTGTGHDSLFPVQEKTLG